MILCSMKYIEEQKNKIQIKKKKINTRNPRQMLRLLIQIIENNKRFQFYIIFGYYWSIIQNKGTHRFCVSFY